ncbi:hypothetical protein CGZ94_04940 [Enemella evansiae]|uniref:Uncharacterized protein n=1 Tax=Enemella evansiae TaxID=2016499 RepID=A0A255GKD7_9ACTN|nr:hypothetical protein [Enemella evansiae]OYO16289.1 hypothetical protein CGZ94_04940 [Enemella evansiae]
MALKTQPRLALTIEPGPDREPIEITVQTDNRDAVAYDLLRERNNWPVPDKGIFIWQTYLAFHALKRLGLLAQHGLPSDFKSAQPMLVHLAPVDEDGNQLELDEHGKPINSNQGEDVDPTQPES